MPIAFDLEVLPDADTLADAAAARFVAAAADAVAWRGRFIVALSGGETPRRTYERLAAQPLASRVTWARTQVVWGDERCVPPDHAESNYRMAREALLAHVQIPEANVHRIAGEDDPAAAAARYETTLRTLLQTPTGPPDATAGARKNFDLVLLGLGEDGHVASLFPGSAALRGDVRWAVPERATEQSMWRVTLTPAVINAAAEVMFIVSGAAKAAILKRVLEGPRTPRELPAQAIAPSHGRVRWYVDAAAAAELRGRS